jgi:uncharacterized UPF0160 family protein
LIQNSDTPIVQGRGWKLFMTTRTIVTHSGGFHADDVFAVATVLLTLEPGSEYVIVRSRDASTIDSGDVVVDVGGVYDPARNRFDHHQRGGAGTHLNGIPYASFGLVWKEFGESICGDAHIAKTIEEKIVMSIDGLDNGVEICTPTFDGVRPFNISDYLYSYWIDEHKGDADIQIIFEEVVVLAKNLLLRLIDKERHIAEDEKEVLAIYEKTEDKRIIVLPKSMAWGKVLASKEEPLFAVYPSDDKLRYQVKGVRAKLGSFDVRRPFPQEWAGKTGSDLQAVTEVPDAIFCHNARFLVVAESVEGALELAHKALA